jgi:DNA-binding transcriptional regulator/RsmH inhibitor MraZ
MKEVGIEKEVLILGTIDKMEFWNPDTYQTYSKKNQG